MLFKFHCHLLGNIYSDPSTYSVLHQMLRVWQQILLQHDVCSGFPWGSPGWVISHVRKLQDCSATAFIDSLFSGALLVTVQSKLSPSWANTQHALKCVYYAKLWPKELLPKVCQSILRVLVADLSYLIQNLKKACCSNLSMTVKIAELFIPQCYKTLNNNRDSMKPIGRLTQW